MSQRDDAKETYSDLKEAFKDQKERAKDEDVAMPNKGPIKEALEAVKAVLKADDFDEDAFEELAEKAEELINAFEEEIDELCEDEDMDEETHARLLALQQSTDEGMAGSVDDLLAKADPALIAPFEGVDVPGWGMAAALITSAGQDEKAQAEALATIGLDMGKYMRVQDHFTARMQGDTTFQLTMIYSKAFTEAQSRLAAQSSGGEVQDGPSVSIEKYAEVSAAMQVWSAEGEDVNANLQSEFGYSAASWSTEQMAWAKILREDSSLYEKIEKLENKFKSKYEGADADDDLDF